MRLSTTTRVLVAASLLAGPAAAVAQNGIEIDAAAFGAQITTTGSDAIRIVDSSDDGIQIGASPAYPNYGVYIPSPGVTTYGLWPNTANASGQWALFTVDDIAVGNLTARSHALVAQVGAGGLVVAGDVVAATGVAEPAPGETVATVVVDRAGPGAGGVVGVVHSRLHWVQPLGKDGERALESAEGPAGPGDLVAVTVAGVATANMHPGVAIVPGQRLVAADHPGRARALRTRRIDGFEIAEGVSVLGVALEASAGDKPALRVLVGAR